jgi:hypothetical protein
MRPSAIEIGRAGSAFLKIAKRSSVRQRPWLRNEENDENEKNENENENENEDENENENDT